MMVFTSDFHSNESSDLGHHKAHLMTQIARSSWLSSVSCLVVLMCQTWLFCVQFVAFFVHYFCSYLYMSFACSVIFLFMEF